MRMFMIALAAMLALGCLGQPASPQNATPPAQNQATPPAQQPPPSQPTGDGTIIEVPPTGNGGTGGTAPPGAQEDCATLTPNCGSCIAKAGCGWCKSSNGCFAGDADGPAGDIQCQDADWAVTDAECQAPSSPQGSSCAEQVGCGNCLTGEGCKFCRQGTVCADINSPDSCFGGWITDYYVCAAGSQ
ncbi:MAG: hypothetical protein AB1529_07350 [Candidatus Micrarchaeota archaeon]